MAERGVGGRQLPLALGQAHGPHGQAQGPKPVPMKLFATWEVDRTPPNCIPRLCSLTLSRLVLLKPLGPDLSSLSIAVKMQGLKRTLRSNELVLPQRGLLDTELQLHFSLQYPHLLKRGGNLLHVSLQRRKRYKNRTFLGYKTLAEGVVNMSQVLQKQLDLELELCGDSKEPKSHHNVLARVSVLGLNSQPVDHEDTAKLNPHDVSDRVGDFSDEDEEFSSNEDGVEEAEGSDSEPMLDDRRARQRQRQGARAGAIPTNARQRNLKQKFISLLKRFRVSEDLQGLDHDQEELAMSHKLSGEATWTLAPHFTHPHDCVCVSCVKTDINAYGIMSTPPSSPLVSSQKCRYSEQDSKSEHNVSPQHSASPHNESSKHRFYNWPQTRLRVLTYFHRESDDADESEC